MVFSIVFRGHNFPFGLLHFQAPGGFPLPLSRHLQARRRSFETHAATTKKRNTTARAWAPCATISATHLMSCTPGLSRSLSLSPLKKKAVDMAGFARSAGHPRPQRQATILWPLRRGALLQQSLRTDDWAVYKLVCESFRKAHAEALAN